MSRLITLSCCCFGLLLSIGDAAPKPPKTKKVPAVLNSEMETLAGGKVKLSKYQGNVVLFVNVASRCGYTPQYEGLEALYKKYKDKGLVVIGVPCNQFGRQEPGTSKQIAEFCKENYGVTFPVLAKVDVNGDGACELYQHLTKKADPPGRVKWNFEKFLIGRDGSIVARYRSRTKPQGKTLVTAIEKELEKK